MKKLVLMLLTNVFLFACADSGGDSNTVTLKTYSLAEKLENSPSIPVYYPWMDNNGKSGGNMPECDNWWYCDTEERPYSLVWMANGQTRAIDSPAVILDNPNDATRMKKDPNTIYLYSDDWQYYSEEYKDLAIDSPFYTGIEFYPHVNSEYTSNYLIRFDKIEWAKMLADKAVNASNVGYNGIMFDWWNNGADGVGDNDTDPEHGKYNMLSDSDISKARMQIAKTIREAVGKDFIILANVNLYFNSETPDESAQYLSGVFLEYWKEPEKYYAHDSNDAYTGIYGASIEALEKTIEYWNDNLAYPNLIAVNPWKITPSGTDFVAARDSSENIQYAKMFTAMTLVIADNGAIMYGDANDDWDEGDHQHAYYDFYKTDIGKPVGERVIVSSGIGYKEFEKGYVIYNRTGALGTFNIVNESITINALSGLFMSK